MSDELLESISERLDSALQEAEEERYRREIREVQQLVIGVKEQRKERH